MAISTTLMSLFRNQGFSIAFNITLVATSRSLSVVDEKTFLTTTPRR